MWSLFDPKEVPELVDLYGEEFAEAYRQAEQAGPLRQAGPGPRPLRPDDAHAGRDRQRLDDASRTPSNRTCQPDRPRPATSCTSPTCAPRSSRSPTTTTPRCATSARSTSAASSSRRRRRPRLRAPRPGRPHRGPLPRPGDRHQLLPDRRGRPVQRGLAPGRASASWASRTCSSRCACRSTRAEAPALSRPHHRGDLLPRPGRVDRAGRGPRPPPALRRDPRRRRAAAVRPVGRRADRPRPLGRRCGPASPSTGCATRCSSPSPRRPPSPRSPAATSASSRRSPTCSSARRCRASSSRSTRYLVRDLQALGLWDRAGRPAQAGRGLDPGHRRHPRRPQGALPHGVGAPACARSSTWPPSAAPFIDQSQSLNLFVESPTIGKLSSMYLHAWKQGLKTTYYLRSRPATRIASTTARTPRPPPSPDADARGLLAREPRDAARPANDASYSTADLAARARRPVRRGRRPAPVTTAARPAPARGRCSTRARPHAAADALPGFYDMYRDAIRNTWTVEEIDFSDDLVDLRPQARPAERHLINRLVAFFATGDSIVANNLVLNLYKHINAPEARLYLSPPALRGGAARPVLPDPARHLPARPGRARPGVRRHREHPVDPGQGRVLLQVDGLDRAQLDQLEHQATTAASSCSTSSASPPASRACSSSPPSPTCTSSARRACSTGWPRAPTGCSATSAMHMNFAFAWSTRPRGGARPVRRRPRPPGAPR